MQFKLLTLAAALIASLGAAAVIPDPASDNTITAVPGVAAVQYAGDVTFYNPSVGLNTCGWINQDWQLVVGVSSAVFGPPNVHDPITGHNSNPICAHRAKVSHGGRTIEVRVVDNCRGCAYEDVDLSPGAFAALGLNPAVGRYHGGSWWLI